MKSTKEKDTGNLQYDWYFSDDKKICEVRERYTNSNALLEHVGNLGDLFGQLLATSDFSVDVYGKPSAKLMKAVEGLNTRVLTPFISKK